MKRLALASVGLAAVSAFGAGDAFATGVTFYATATAFGMHESTNDHVDWNTAFGSALPGGTTGLVTSGSPPIPFSAASTKGHTINGIYHPAVSASVSVFNQGTGSITAGFAHLAAVLVANKVGTLTLSFTHTIDALSFVVSPDGASTSTKYDADVSVFNNATLLGSETSASTVKTSCTGNTCNFIGIVDTAGFNKIEIALQNTSTHVTAFAPAVGNFTMQDMASVPEPASLSVLGVGLLGLAALGRRRRPFTPDSGMRWSPFGRWRVVDPPDQTTC